MARLSGCKGPPPVCGVSVMFGTFGPLHARGCEGVGRAAIISPMATTSAPTIGQPRRRRRWFQFGLGTLLGLITLTAVWLGALVNRAERQRRAVAAVQHLGGEVAYVDQGLSWTPEWLRAWARERYFQTVTAVSLMNVTQVTDADLTHFE